MSALKSFNLICPLFRLSLAFPDKPDELVFCWCFSDEGNNDSNYGGGPEEQNGKVHVVEVLAK